nr:MAG TPA: hypothetical protein [Caudoviricetes sp.]
MPLKIYFDDITHEPLMPTLVLANRNGDKLGVIPSSNLVVSDALKIHSELSFKVYKTLSGVDYPDWDKIKDFQLLWCKEWNEFFELNVELNESNEIVKDVIATSLSEAELSQTNLYNVEINTEDDIAREDYKDPTVFYNTSDSKSSLLNRILEKVPHYEIKHVDTSLKDIQRTFSFDGKSVYDALQEIEEEINCLFVFSTADNNGNLKRGISAYDLESYCYECNHRGEFLDKCPKCGSTKVKNGFGEDTTIFVSTDNLTDEITYSTDVGAVKNCFKLEAGDDLMTATIANCNPNGSSYIWYIPESIRKDMSPGLHSKLTAYDEKYEYYQKEHKTSISSSVRNKYNVLLAKYRAMFPNTTSVDIPSDIPSEIVGYPNLMLAYYDTIDFELFLRSKLMPTVSLTPTTAQKEVKKITKDIITSGTNSISVLNIDSASLNTITNIITSLVRSFVNSDYKVQANDGATYDKDNTHMWKGSFNIYKYSDTSDSADTSVMEIKVVDTYSTYVSQQLTKALADAADENPYGIVALFRLGDEKFKAELKKYGLNSLASYRTTCQACLDILIEQGVSNKDYWDKESNGNTSNNLYNKFYLNYFNKLKYIDDEIKIRETELNIVVGIKDDKDRIVTDGMQSLVEKAIIEIQDVLNFQKFLVDNWTEFISYRREDTYSNSNYISDGLDNAELLNRANEFLEVAKKEIVKSATLQHSISATLKNLLVMKEFSPLTSYFKVGNWLRICVDENVYRLRLMSYEIDFDSLETLNVTFSDVMSAADGYSDIESILSQAESMSTSYDGIMRQAKQGSKGNQMLQNWVAKGLDLTNMKIIGKASNQNISWDENGFLCREYSEVTDEYDDRQLKIINRGLYVTDDGWKTAKAGIGNFTFYNPKNEKWEESYGVIADTLVGNLILSEEVGIYNTENTITLDKNGLVITVEPDAIEKDQTTFLIRRKKDVPGEYDKVLEVDAKGNAYFKGTVSATGLFIEADDTDVGVNDYFKNYIDMNGDPITLYYKETVPLADIGEYWYNTSLNGIIASDSRYEEALPIYYLAGVLWQMVVSTEEDSTNALFNSLDMKGVPIGKKWLYENRKINSVTGEPIENNGTYITGLIPASHGNIIRLRWSPESKTKDSIGKNCRFKAFTKDFQECAEGYVNFSAITSENKVLKLDKGSLEEGKLDFTIFNGKPTTEMRYFQIQLDTSNIDKVAITVNNPHIPKADSDGYRKDEGALIWKEIPSDDKLYTVLQKVQETTENPIYNSDAKIYTQTADPVQNGKTEMNLGNIWLNNGTGEASFWDGKKWNTVIGANLSVKKDIEKLQSELNAISGATNEALNRLSQNEEDLKRYREESTKYISYDENLGLIVGAKENQFKTVIGNKSMEFWDGDYVVAYISKEQLSINNAVVRGALYFKKFFFAPHEKDGDDGFSIYWVV